MSEPRFVNEGIVVGGEAQVQDSALAAGRHAQAHLSRVDAGSADVRDGLDAIQQALADLRELLARHEAEVPQAAQAFRDIDDVRDEIVRARDGEVADGDRVRDALERLTGRVGAVGALAAALHSLKEVILRATQ